MPASRLSVLPSDTRAYAAKKRAAGGDFVTYEEESLVTGMHQNAISFQLADDGDRRLSLAEFMRLVREREMGSPSDEELVQRFHSIDTDGSGHLDMSEYVLFSLRDALSRSSERVLDLFRAWDKVRWLMQGPVRAALP